MPRALWDRHRADETPQEFVSLESDSLESEISTDGKTMKVFHSLRAATCPRPSRRTATVRNRAERTRRGENLEGLFSSDYFFD